MYNLTLQVADMSGDGLTATASAIITLEDINDNAPSFTREEVNLMMLLEVWLLWGVASGGVSLYEGRGDMD